MQWVQLYSHLYILWHCLYLGLEWKLTFTSPVATAEFSKFAGILSVALEQYHLSAFEIAQLEFHHCSQGMYVGKTRVTCWRTLFTVNSCPSSMLLHISLSLIFRGSHSVHWLLHQHYHHHHSYDYLILFYFLSISQNHMFPKVWPCCLMKLRFLYVHRTSWILSHIFPPK